MWSKSLEIESLKGTPIEDKVTKMLEGISNTGWLLKGYDSSSNKLSFITKSEIILNFKDKKAGLDYSLNCGKYICSISLKDMSIRVQDPDSFMIRNVGTYCHPHIGSSELPCWGNASSSVTAAVKNGDIGTILKILESLLQNYNPDSPYVSIKRFKVALESKERMINEQKTKKNVEKPNEAAAPQSQAAMGPTAYGVNQEIQRRGYNSIEEMLRAQNLSDAFRYTAAQAQPIRNITGN